MQTRENIAAFGILEHGETDGSTVVLSRAPNRGKGCDHRSTDGTVDCRDCGVTASAFIKAAGEYIGGLA